MTGIQDLLSSSEDDVKMTFQYDPAERFQQQQQEQRRQTTRLPSLSVLMQPHAPFEYNNNSSSSSHDSQVPPHQQGMPYAQASSQYQQQGQYYPPASPSGQQNNWSPASATSSVDSASDAPFPIRRQTFYARGASGSAVSSPSSSSSHQQQQQQQSQSQQQRPPCSCGCDPVSSDDEAMMILPRPSPVSTGSQQKMGISPTSKSSSSSSSHHPDSTSSSSTGAKKSRYLREMDRRAILARLDKGEKQSVLAKEYQVSRSSICNLFKHRDEVLSRVNQNPFTKHPKKPRNTTGSGEIANKATEKLITCVKAIYSPFTQTGAAIPSDAAIHQLFYDANGRVHRVNSRAASVLLSILDKSDITAPEFRRCSNQIMLLLIEEALVMIPTLNAAASSGTQSRLSPSPLCAITMEQANQHALLDVFHSVEPNCPRGYVQFERSQWHQDVKIKLLDTQLLSALFNHNVLLLDVAVTSPPMVAFVIESLLRNGAVEAKITIVAVFVAREVVEMVMHRFPAVRIIATDIEGGLPQQQTPQQPRPALYQERIGGSQGQQHLSMAMMPPLPRSVLFKQRLEHMHNTNSNSQAI